MCIPKGYRVVRRYCRSGNYYGWSPEILYDDWVPLLSPPLVHRNIAVDHVNRHAKKAGVK